MSTTDSMAASVTIKAQKLGPYIAGFLGIQLFISAANSGIGGLLIPNRIAILDDANKVALLGVTAGAVAAVSLIAAPVWGMLSDRTRGRFGRRMPWILAGVIGVSVFAASLAFANDILATIILFAIFGMFVAMVTSPISATMPDRTPVSKRGLFSAIAGIGVFVGGIIGNIIASVFTSNLFAGFIAFAIIALAGSLPLIGTMREDTSDRAAAPKTTFVEMLRAFWVSPRKYPDFFWAFVARLVIVIGFQSVISFQLYILTDYVGLDLAEANSVYPIAVILATVALVLALVPAGIISDRIGRRKPIVIVSAIIVAASTIPPLIAPTIPVAIISLTIAGIGIGGYLAVDQALMTQVLPSNDDAGKDLGILNIAQQGGAVLAPVFAAIMISIAGYQGLYIFAGVLSALSALAVLPIRSVR
ncbi:Na+/melibiose symporter [Microbacterium sp. cf046]|uniref:MFS transporter n=1 Tax=Microbacterium sp. cf046 TaxID=1761803 RepID=UPI0008EE5423|nr:MFS transporter [Microbacterium sp. cf046]SFS14575.1 Na+/melibiose symporter [Microbacterium sp. cf046]